MQAIWRWTPIIAIDKLSDHNDKASENKKNKKREIYLQKCSKGLLAEAVLIAGKPAFVVSRNGQIYIKDSIEVEGLVIKPLEATSYLNKPYVFDSEDEFNVCIEKAKQENLDSLYKSVRSVWKKYVDASDFHISLCAADTIYSYRQDQIGLTHYLFFIGDNTSGKSNNLSVIHQLAYRNLMSSDITAANVYQFFGSYEEGQGTLCVDEADEIDNNTDLMRIFKNGYTSGFPVARVDTSQGRKQDRYFTFGFKAFSAERLPDSLTAKGLNQRIVKLPCTYGIPPYDISEILNPAGEEKLEALLHELNELRNSLLAHRILHFHERINDIQVNLSARERQLFKPVIRIFQCTDTLAELLPVISRFVSERRESNANSWHAFLYRLITDLVKTQDTIELESTLIWNTVMDILPGDSAPNRRLSYESSEFGHLSQKSMVETLIQVFGAKQSPNRRDSRKLIFDLSKLKKLSQIYDLSLEVKVGTGVTDETHVTDIGLDKYVQEQEQDRKNNNGGEEKKRDRDSSSSSNTTSSTTEAANSSHDTLTYANNPSQVSHLSHVRQPALNLIEEELPTQESRYIMPLEDIVAVSKTIHRIHPRSDIFRCDNCRLRGDKREMGKHLCRGLKK